MRLGDIFKNALISPASKSAARLSSGSLFLPLSGQKTVPARLAEGFKIHSAASNCYLN
jgi:hypothetical protein